MLDNQLKTDRKYMRRCLELAIQAEGFTYPNPLVGSVVVHNGKIIGEGFHQKAGSAHAEVNAIETVKEKSLLQQSVLYVNLEPCAHYGKTPPCALLIKQHKIPRVVIGCVDTFSQVAGKGIKILRDAGVDVVTGILEKESRELNRRFFTFHEQNRPFVILKWAETRDGFLDIDREVVKDNRPNWITNDHARRMVHLWRSREQSIMVGSITALKDNPSLTVRDWSGHHPLRVVIDRGNKLPEYLALFDGEAPTLWFTGGEINDKRKAENIVLPQNKVPIIEVLDELYKRDIQSVIIEGGAQLLNAFIEMGLWDEARVFVGNRWFQRGIKAPRINVVPLMHERFDESDLFVYRNKILI
ncbi:bifunctional diaminohydroxyphosphoribosylaminopyrimidine deaminase/5-amino-6-(5-phosphoribosylamino)uracil reductase RibD [Alkalitalea saponilacus]|uniref:Riboflavin biosynthesis protein RibD n=1 Tax=Alkalitalea saponilacus TaxID=889453 RepID=A0A1T5AGJ7_9BACT|nr:bifunctional diaminohydroxyphosphoribosylaminopyrimidine deaminase/5-amino-6-(5-phosphoribosylamino)uracil reductase RibD [Alkalitalea saponilacus]ASB51065.1 riboflavin biosynthesis protein RibD [Alkalitalea saponilacus]SKB34108.1 diaminohydroxyphosphoribosylaminopyrimidine deaminase [Alkalitalea saponilacus]